MFFGMFVKLQYDQSMTVFKLKRAYQAPSADDGFRVYIDRLWPRGLSHQQFSYDLWDKDIAPSTELREWFHADSDARWDGFEQRYAVELHSNPSFAALRTLLLQKPVVTLLYSSHDSEHNNAVALLKLLKE